MHDASIVIQRPSNVRELVLLFHGVGASAESMLPLGQLIAQHSPDSAVVSIQAPNLSSLGHGAQWFSVAGITEDNRPERIAAALPVFLESVQWWQHSFGIGSSQTTLIGFSQGAIMCLHAALANPQHIVAGRVMSLAGRFAAEPQFAPKDVRFHLIHGEQDNVIAADYSIQAGRWLQRMGATVSIDLLPGLGHTIDNRVLHIIQGRRSQSTMLDYADAG
jgi:phospholipase/carboxylesterase